MKDFMDEDFLLENETAKKLFHSFAKDMPVCDYHCHLSPKEIYENKACENITELWLSGDHYKWRAMRSCGFSEELCTGNADPKEKFVAFAETLQYAIGNPLYHWAHLELRKYFGITQVLNKYTAETIYSEANEKIKAGDFRPRTIIKSSGVKVICTTDDPADTLEYHILLKNEKDFDVKVLPTFRPDKALNIELDGFSDYIKKLSEVSGTEIDSAEDVVQALLKRADFFNSVGCRVSDQSFEAPVYAPVSAHEANEIFKRAMSGEKVSVSDTEKYKTYIFKFLGEKYCELGWVMEIHIGAMRNNNSIMFSSIGPDTGFDSPSDKAVICTLSKLLDMFCKENKLAKTVLFNLNSRDNEALCALCGNFQSSDACGKIQFGPAWWFLDTIDGMTAQLKTLGNLGILGRFIGMETDSRSFTSYPRHEYFRRILCNIIGEWIEKGMYSYDERIVKEIIEGICYNNAVKYFGF